MNLNWFLSRTVRHATHMRKHVWKILSAQRDLLSPQAITAVTAAMEGTQRVCEGRLDKKAVEAQMTNLETVANKWLKPYPNAALRENIEVLLVAIAVAMAIRTFIAQPFKIPTGSMQPTLYGVTAGGIPGAAKALQIFRREIDISMAQMGATKIADLGPQFLMWQDEEDLRRNRR